MGVRRKLVVAIVVVRVRQCPISRVKVFLFKESKKNTQMNKMARTLHGITTTKTKTGKEAEYKTTQGTENE